MYCKYCGKPIEKIGTTCKFCGNAALPLEGGIGFWDICDAPNQPTDLPPVLPQPNHHDKHSPLALYIMNVILIATVLISAVIIIGNQIRYQKNLDTQMEQFGKTEATTEYPTEAELESEAASTETEVVQSLAQMPDMTDPSSYTCEAYTSMQELFVVYVDQPECNFIWEKQTDLAGGWDLLDSEKFISEGTPMVDDHFQITLSGEYLESLDGGLYRCVVITESGERIESNPAELTVVDSDDDAEVDLFDSDMQETIEHNSTKNTVETETNTENSDTSEPIHNT